MPVQHKARYSNPGFFFSESYSIDLEERSVAEAIEKAPKSAFCFTLYDLPIVEDDLGDDFKIVPKPKNESDKYYLGGQVYTVEEVKACHPDKKTLISNAEGNGYDRLILCKTGNWQPFEDGDVVVQP